ncbi:MAG: hypothetical protein ACKN9T_19610 [Candidatus Methylumidiphilus sp.]
MDIESVDKSVASIEKTGSAIASIIPQMFFDLIARILPGFAIIWSFYLAFLGNNSIGIDCILEKASDLLPKDNMFFVFSITIVTFYTASVLFYGLWSAICSFLAKKFKHSGMFFETTETNKYEFVLRHDYIKLNAPSAGSRITKLKAEIHMSGALAVAFSMCFAISCLNFFNLFGCNSMQPCLTQPQKICRAVFFGFGVIGFWYSHQHFLSRYRNSVLSYSTILLYDKRNYTYPVDLLASSDAPQKTDLLSFKDALRDSENFNGNLVDWQRKQRDE